MTFLISISLWLVEGLLKYQPSTEQNPPTSLPVFTCPSCGSHHTIKNGYIHNGKPKLHCQECGQPFVINPTNKTRSPDTKQLIDQLLLELISWRGIARVAGVSWSWLRNYVNVSTSLDVDPERSRKVNNKLSAVPCQLKVSDKPKGKLLIECDEMCPFVFSKTIKVYIWLVIDRKTRELIGGYLGYRSRQSAKKLLPSLPSVYRQCAVTYTHFWESYKTIVPSKRHREVQPRTWSN